MKLGERIYTLRTQKNLSQEDLAEALGVSRQSISKWETNGAMPEIGKLVQLSNLFGVTLDALVKGDEPPTHAEPTAPIPPETTDATHSPLTKQIVGMVLLGFGLLITLLFLLMGGGLGGLLYSSPLFLCGILCLCVRRHTGLWCAWSLYFCIDFYLRYATGITWKIIFQTIGFQPEWNYMRLATGWALCLSLVLMIVWTLYTFRNATVIRNTKRWVLLACGWAGLYGLRCLQGAVNQILIARFQTRPAYDSAWETQHLWLNFAGDYLCLAALLALLIWTILALRQLRKR